MLDDIESGALTDVREMNARFSRMHENYYTYEWTWVYGQFREYYGIDPENITVEQVVELALKWKDSVVALDRMVYEDARKEFSLSAMTGFGADGDKSQQNLDFEEVRGGAFESNPSVQAIEEHIRVKSALGDEFISRMQR